MKRWGTVAAVLLVGALAALVFLTLTATGFRWFAGALDGLSGGRIVLSGVDGHLGSPLTIGHLALKTETRRIDVEGLRFEWRPRALWQGRLDVDLLAARSARVTTLKEDVTPPQLPDSLRLPVDVRVRVFDLARLDVVNGQTLTFERLRASLDDDGARYRIEDAMLVTPWADVQGRFTLGKDAPFALAARVDAVRAQPVDVHGRLELAGTLSAVRFDLQAAAETMRLMAQGDAAPFASVRVPRLLIAGEGIDPRLFAPDAPAADIAFSGAFEGRPGERMLGNFSLTNRRAGRIDEGRLPLADLTAAVAGVRGDAGVAAEFSALMVDLGRAGRLSGSGRWRDGKAGVALAGKALDLGAVHSTLRNTRLGVALHLAGNAQTQTLEADLVETRGRGRIELTHGNRALQLNTARFSGDFGQLTATGTLQLDATRAFAARVDAARIDPSRLGRFPRARLYAQGDIRGRLAPRFQIRGAVTLPRGELEGRPVVGRGKFQYADAHLSGVDVDIDVAGNRATAEGAYGRAGDRLAWEIDAPALARLRLGFGGRLQSSGTLAGDPSRLQVDAELHAADLRLPGAIAADRVDARVTIGARPRDAFDGEVDARNLRRGEQRLNAFRARVDGRRNAHAIVVEARHPEWRLNARLAGGLEAGTECPRGLACPAGTRWRGRLLEAAVDGRWPMRLTAPASLLLSRARQQVDGLALTVAGGNITRAQFIREGTRWSTRGVIDGVPLAPVLAWVPQGERVTSDLRVDGDWDVRAGETLDGVLHLRRQSGDVRLKEPALALGLSAVTLDMVAAKSVADVRLALATRDGGRVRLDGRGTLQRDGFAFVLPRTTPLAWTMDASLPDLRLARAFLPVGTRADAVVEVRLAGRGTLAAPILDGTLDARRIRFAMPEEGVAIIDGVLRLMLAEGRVRVREGVLQGRSGRVLVGGDAAIDSREAGLDLRFERFSVTSRADRNILVSGLARLRLDPERMVLTGELVADRARVRMPEASRPTLSSDVVVVGREPREQATTERVPLALDLTLKLGDDFLFEGAGLDARLGGALRVFTVEQARQDHPEGKRRAASPQRVLRGEGTIRVEEGRYSAYAQTLEIERGALRFVGPIDNPGLDVLAVRKTAQVKVGVQVGGTVQRPVVTLVSDPPLPDTEKLSWLVLGHGLESSDQQEFALLQVAAGALLSRAESVNVQARLADALGIDVFDVRAGSSEDLASTVVSVGKRLSSRATLSYEQSLDGLSQVVKVLYQLSPRIRLEAQAGQPSSFDAFYTREYD